MSVAREVLAKLNPTKYLRQVAEWTAFVWQQHVLSSLSKRIMLNCNRQAGKSTVTATIIWHQAKHYANSLILLFSPTERQTKELMEKVMDFAEMDPELELVEDNVTTKRLSNGSRVIALPGVEKNIRGYSDPDLIVIDEASRAEDGLYRAIRPMMASGKTRLIVLSTPFGKRGWFYEEWTGNDIWEKILVTAPVRIVDGQLVQPEPEERFAERMMEQGVHAYYSPRHSFEFMQEEWRSMPEWWFRQEYLGEFMEAEDAVFKIRDLDYAFGGHEVVTPFREENNGSDGGGARRFDWAGVRVPARVAEKDRY